MAKQVFKQGEAIVSAVLAIGFWLAIYPYLATTHMPSKVTLAYLILIALLIRPTRLTKALTYTALVFSILEVSHTLTGWPILFDRARNAPWELFWGNPNYLGEVLGFTAVLAIAAKLTIPAALLSVMAALTLNKSVVLGLLIGIVGYIATKRGYFLQIRLMVLALLAALGTTLSYILYTLKPDSLSPRWELLIASLKLTRDYDMGAIKFWPTIDLYYLGKINPGSVYHAHPHNDFLWLNTHFGSFLTFLIAIGLATLAMYHIKWQRYALHAWAFTALFFSQMMFQHPLGMPWVWVLSTVYLTHCYGFPPRAIRYFLAGLLLIGGSVHTYHNLIVHPFRTPDHHTTRWCNLGSHRACRLTGDWKTSLRHTPYDRHMLRRAALTTGQCLPAWLYDSMMKARPTGMFYKTGCYAKGSLTTDRLLWKKGYDLWWEQYR